LKLYKPADVGVPVITPFDSESPGGSAFAGDIVHVYGPRPPLAPVAARPATAAAPPVPLIATLGADVYPLPTLSTTMEPIPLVPTVDVADALDTFVPAPPDIVTVGADV